MTRTRSQSGKLSREKGERFMRECVRILQDAGIGCQKRSQYRGARKDGCDIEMTDWWIECTHGKGADPRVKYAQALRDQDERQASSCSWCDGTVTGAHGERCAEALYRPIVVLWKRDGMRGILATMQLGNVSSNHYPDALVTMSIDDWIRIAKEAP